MVLLDAPGSASRRTHGHSKSRAASRQLRAKRRDDAALRGPLRVRDVNCYEGRAEDHGVNRLSDSWPWAARRPWKERGT